MDALLRFTSPARLDRLMVGLLALCGAEGLCIIGLSVSGRAHYNFVVAKFVVATAALFLAAVALASAVNYHVGKRKRDADALV